MEAPWKLAGYRVEGLLGRGASGEVWRGRTVADEPVALKRIALHDAQLIRAARSEAALLATLDHPHLIRLHELVATGDAIVLVLDLAAAGSLADLITGRGRLTPGEVITAIAPIGAALAYAHAAGVVHGDVSAANILFTEAGLPLLADLGVARLLGDPDPVRSTPAYLDPAVAAGSVPGPQSDVFMLGAVALHALTGAPAWSGASPEQTMAAALAGDLGPVESRLTAARIPEEIRDVVGRALSREPGRRGTAADFALDLRHAGEPLPVELTAGRPRVEPSTTGLAGVGGAGLYTHALRPRPRPTPGRRRRTPTARERFGARRVVVALSGLALAAGAGIAWTRLDHPPSHGPRVVASPADATTGGSGSRGRPLDSGTPSSPSGGALGTRSEGPTSSVTSSGVPTSAEAASTLTQLDQLREAAFARRAPLLLGGVYEPGSLLQQDTALLAKLVPAGCALEGVHTTYGTVSVIAGRRDTYEVSVRAALSPSVLVCNGVAKGRAPGSGPTALRIVLVRKGSGYLISGVTR